MVSKALLKRYNKIASGKNEDASDEYYTLHPAFMSLLAELINRHLHGKTYKLIICPCDSETSVFRELVNYTDLLGNPQVHYDFYPHRDWKEYFDMDYEKEFGVNNEDVIIFTNPPFKSLGQAMTKIKVDYLLFGSNVTSITEGIYGSPQNGYWYMKNTSYYEGKAKIVKNYGSVKTD